MYKQLKNIKILSHLKSLPGQWPKKIFFHERLSKGLRIIHHGQKKIWHPWKALKRHGGRAKRSSKKPMF